MIPRGGKRALVLFGVSLVLAALAAVALVGASRVTTASGQGATVADAFSGPQEFPPGADTLTQWRPDVWDGTRALDFPTRRNIEAAYVRAWNAIGRFAAFSDRDPIDAWLVGPAKAAVLAIAPSEATPVWSLGHELELRFFSNDGSVVGFRDHAARLIRQVDTAAGNMITVTEERFDVVLTLENNYWRVRHLRRIDGVDTRTVLEEVVGVSIVPARTAPARRIDPMHGINYEPKEAPFQRRWDAFDATTTGEDFDTVRSLGLDTVRVFVPFIPSENLDGSQRELRSAANTVRNTAGNTVGNLRVLLDLADERNLRVVVTLFDGHVDHRPFRWAEDEAYLRSLVGAVGDHPALAMWDVKNEPDRDDGLYASRLEVRAWLAQMTSALRELDPTRPVTIGWSSPEAARDPSMAALVDVVTFHWYRPAAEVRDAIQQVRVGAKDRPIMLGEFGLPTYNSIFPGGHTEAEQARYYADILSTARATGVTSSLSWTLHDLSHARSNEKRPWRTGPQRSLGVLRADGSRKPAAEILRPGYDYSAVARTGWLNRLEKTSWKFATSLAALAASFVAFQCVRSRR